MRLRKHKVGFLLLLSALPHLSADDTAVADTVVPSTNNNDHQINNNTLDEEIPAAIDTDDPLSSKEIPSLPKDEEDSFDQEHFEESLTQSTESQSTMIQSSTEESLPEHEAEDVAAAAAIHTDLVSDTTENTREETENEEPSATETVHEDGFRILPLSKANVVAATTPKEKDQQLEEGTIEQGGNETVVVLSDAKLAIGTTSVDLDVPVDSTDERSLESNQTLDSSPTEQVPHDETTKAAPVVDAANDDDLAPKDPEESADEEEASSEGDIIDGGDADEESKQGNETEDKTSLKQKIAEVEEDEDLTDRISVDYASKSAGALIIEKSSEWKGTSDLITGNRDKYAIIPCSEEKKYVLLSLSEDILVKEIKLANYERFSSTTKDFQVKGSHNLQKWVDLGTYRAKAGNGEQSFVLENPAWARYLKFNFLTHHGVEYYCTLSQIKVHGSNMVQGFHEQWESIEEENNEEPIVETTVSDTKMEEKSASETANATEESLRSVEEEKSTEQLVDESVVSTSTHEDETRPNKALQDTPTTQVPKPISKKSDFYSIAATPRPPLVDFRTPSAVTKIITGDMEDSEQLFSDLYDLIPHTMNKLPANTKNSLDDDDDDEGELRRVHQIKKLAMDSLYSFGTKIVDGFAIDDKGEGTIGTIVSPKMEEIYDDYIQKKFGTGLSSMLKLHSLTGAPSTTENEPSQEHKKSVSSESPEDNLEATSQAKTTDQQDQTIAESIDAKETNELSSSVGSESDGSENAGDPINAAIAKLLKDLPSAECLVHLDFSEFKQKISAARKSTTVAGGSHGGRAIEPIFKKLTDEIFALQTSLSVHDQFSKLSVACYQRVLLDLAIQTESIRQDHNERLSKLEEQLLEPASWRMVRKLVVAMGSTICSWAMTILTSLWVSMNTVWIPKLLHVLLSDETNQVISSLTDSLQNKANSVVDLLCNLSTKFNNSNDWLAYGAAQYAACRTVLPTLTKRETYQKFVASWSSYYDAGVVLVACAIAILVFRGLTALGRRKDKKDTPMEAPAKRRPVTPKKDPPSTCTLSTATGNIQFQSHHHPDELVLSNNHHPDDTSHVTFASTASSSKKKKKRKSRNKRGNRTGDDHSLRSTEDPVPELEDETDDIQRDRPWSPSVVSLEG